MSKTSRSIYKTILLFEDTASTSLSQPPDIMANLYYYSTRIVPWLCFLFSTLVLLGIVRVEMPEDGFAALFAWTHNDVTTVENTRSLQDLLLKQQQPRDNESQHQQQQLHQASFQSAATATTTTTTTRLRGERR
jgi:hypothetical protein